MSLISGFEHIVRENEPLAPFTRLNIGGVAEYFAEPTTKDELVALVKRFAENDLPIRLMGSGTNVLIQTQGIAGLVVHLSAPAFGQIVIDGDTMVVGGGAKLSHFVASAVREGLTGPQHLVGITGTVGGALHSNTSAVGFDIGSWVQSAEVLNRSGDLVTHEKENMSFSYRQSSLSELAILSATFKFDSESAEALTKQMQKLWIVRRAAQPAADERAAYVFKDHGGDTASSLIDQAGLKGTRVGEVEVCDRDPNFFIAHDGATADDFQRLIELVQTRVRDQQEIELQTSIGIW